MNDETQKKEISTTIQIYGGFILAIILNFVPLVSAQMIGALLLFILVIATYIKRKRTKSDFIKNHMSFMIKGFWVSSLMLLIGILAAYILGDHSVINGIMASVEDGQIITEPLMEAALMQYTRDNYLVFALCLTPPFIYLVARAWRGIMRAKQSAQFENPKAWL